MYVCMSMSATGYQNKIINEFFAGTVSEMSSITILLTIHVNGIGRMMRSR
jgi:hypothetical protein